MELKVKLFTDEVMKEMGKRIQDARKKKGYKAIDFADIIGIGKDQLSRIETGKVVCKTDYLFVIAQELGVTSDFLLYGESKTNDEMLVPLLMDMSSETREKAIKILKILSE